MAKKSEKKRKHSEDEDAVDDVQAQLAAYGERFMQMFEPTEVDTRHTRASSEELASSEDTQSASSSGEGNNNSSSSSDDDDAADAADAAVEHIFRTSIKPAPPGKKRLANAVIAPSLPSRVVSADVVKQERKRFMSHRAGVISGDVPVVISNKNKKKAQDEDADGGLTKEEFKKLQREVHLYGATALDKKSKKQFDAAMLQELGAKKAKGMRIPANMAIGMAKKRAKREAVAMEEAIAAGMVKVKGTGKKKRAEKRAGLDKGLMEDGGAFKGGVLKVKKGGSGGDKRGFKR